MDVLMKCLRCKQPFVVVAGPNITDFCSTCRKHHGSRMFDHRRAHMNSNYRFQVETLGIPAGGDSLPQPLVFVGPRHRSK